MKMYEVEWVRKSDLFGAVCYVIGDRSEIETVAKRLEKQGFCISVAREVPETEHVHPDDVFESPEEWEEAWTTSR